MAKPSNNGNISELSSQYLDNLEHDNVTGAKGVSIYGTPDGTNIYRLKVNSDGSINAASAAATPLKTLIDKTTTTNVVYIGQAASGTATSASSWTITKIDKTASPVAITHTGATAVYDNRASETYS